MNHCARLIALAAALSAVTAWAQPSKDQITQARGECRAHKLKVLAAERDSDGADPRLAAMRLEWEHACLRAQKLMDEAAGTEPPEPAEPAAMPAG